jgi:hypothetical protein
MATMRQKRLFCRLAKGLTNGFEPSQKGFEPSRCEGSSSKNVSENSKMYPKTKICEGTGSFCEGSAKVLRRLESAYLLTCEGCEG